VRGMELRFRDAAGAEDAAQYMRECHADEGTVRPADEPAVLVRASTPGSRDVFHGDVECGLLSGRGRRLEDASWMLLGNAKAVGYGPCMRCGSLASAT
jgi:hypothetical protein